MKAKWSSQGFIHIFFDRVWVFRQLAFDVHSPSFLIEAHHAWSHCKIEASCCLGKAECNGAWKEGREAWLAQQPNESIVRVVRANPLNQGRHFDHFEKNSQNFFSFPHKWWCYNQQQYFWTGITLKSETRYGMHFDFWAELGYERTEIASIEKSSYL